jgi:DNA-binding XRE family transcriptional regulator
MHQKDLAEFLWSRRETLQPGDVGLPAGARRRTKGLRREEVAALAGMSTDYYARLEQQRSPQPSVPMVAALARALRLTLDERDHLFTLVGHSVPARHLRSEHVSPTLLRVLDRLDDSPALVVDDLAAVLAQNALNVALTTDKSRHTGLARSAYYRWFVDPEERAHYAAADHVQLGRTHVARLRAAVTAGSDRQTAARIVDELQGRSQEFREFWKRQEVTQRYEDRRSFVHPELGQIDLDCEYLYVENRAQSLIVLTARPGSESYDKVKLLSVIGHQSWAAGTL